MSMLKLELNPRNRQHPSQATIVARGNLYPGDIMALCAQISGLIDVGVHAAVLDLGATGPCNPDTQRSLAWLQDRMRGRGVELSILGSDPPTPRRSPDAGAPKVPDASVDRSAFTAHCEQPGMPGYRPETVDQP
jgi:hypothetical protein